MKRQALEILEPIVHHLLGFLSAKQRLRLCHTHSQLRKKCLPIVMGSEQWDFRMIQWFSLGSLTFIAHLNCSSADVARVEKCCPSVRHLSIQCKECETGNPWLTKFSNLQSLDLHGGCLAVYANRLPFSLTSLNCYCDTGTFEFYKGDVSNLKALHLRGERLRIPEMYPPSLTSLTIPRLSQPLPPLLQGLQIETCYVHELKALQVGSNLTNLEVINMPYFKSGDVNYWNQSDVKHWNRFSSLNSLRINGKQINLPL